ncbi:MAG: DUF4276 family protein [Methanoregula sp.]|nr:DUF4276 family protein [Methanoregula sp.]
MERTKVFILVEGQTEATFVRDIIAPHLWEKGIDTWYSIIPTAIRERTFRGGITSFEAQARPVLLRLLHGRNRYVTTMFDYYGLPRDFPGMDTLPLAGTAYEKIHLIEMALMSTISNRLFIPYLQLHEFEAILFSDINILDHYMQTYGQSRISDLSSILNKFRTPELIDDNPETSPSKRLMTLYPNFHKRFDGNEIAKLISLGTIRKRCLHFDHWLNTLEHLAPIR